MLHRQPRTYPLLGFLLANFLTNAVLAKFAPLSGIQHAYHSDPWLWNGKPAYEDYHQEHYPSHWKPVLYPPTYAPPPVLTTPSLTTERPEIGQQQIININHFPADYGDDYYEDTNSENGQEISTDTTNYDGVYDGNTLFRYNEGNQSDIEPIASGTNYNARRQKPSNDYLRRATYYPKYATHRAPPNQIVRERYNRYKNGQKRKRYTTPNYYEDSYEELTTTAYRPRRKTRPHPYNRRTTTEPSYYDDDYYEAESYETTTRPYRRRKPSKNKNKRRPVYNDDDYSYDNVYEYNDREPLTETLTLRPSTRPAPTLRQRQEAQTETETTTSTTTSTTMATNTTTNTTANSTVLYGPGSGNNISITYTPPGNDYLYPTFTGYGPSNGNENISITYGPPTRLDYGAPSYFAWYPQQQTRTNDIVRKVHDIVGFDRNIFRRRLT